MISIVIPVYRAEDILGHCLEAIFRSTYRDFEVLVVDDASPDRSMEIARRYPVKVLQQATHRGPPASRNMGVYQAKGDVILFIDSDVVIDNRALEYLADDFTNPEVGAAFLSKPSLERRVMKEFDGVGWDRSKSFDGMTLTEIVDLDVKDLLQLPGIGSKTALSIYNQARGIKTEKP